MTVTTYTCVCGIAVVPSQDLLDHWDKFNKLLVKRGDTPLSPQEVMRCAACWSRARQVLGLASLAEFEVDCRKRKAEARRFKKSGGFDGDD